MSIFDRSRERADAEAARADREAARADRAEADAARTRAEAEACERRYNPPVTTSRIVPGSYEGGKRR